MPRRNKILLFVSALLIVLAIILIVLSLGKKEQPIVVNTNKVTVVGPAANANYSGSLNINAKPIVTQEPKTQAIIQAVALTFAEKFGTYSSQSEFENLKDLEVFMTANMKRWSEEYKTKNSNSRAFSEFYGITTKALKAEIITLGDQEQDAQVLVNTQRQEVKGNAEIPYIYYQKLLLNMVKDDSSWKIDAATWQ